MTDQISRLLRLASEAGLAGVERSVSYGTPSLKVRGKFLARLTDDATLAIKCPREDKAMLMEAEPDYYYETDHYRGYDAFLIRLESIDDAGLRARLEGAWKIQAGARLIRSRTPQN